MPPNISKFIDWVRELFKHRRGKHATATGATKDSISRTQWYSRIAFSRIQTDEIVSLAHAEDLHCLDFTIDKAQFDNWRASCEDAYPRPDPESIPSDIRGIAESLRTEKFLEYFTTLSLAKIRQGAVIADIGSAQSSFLELVVNKFDVAGWAVDPSLAGLKSEHPKISFLPELISVAANQLPTLDAVFLHCSFEMFEPVEMEAMIRVAAQKLAVGGRLIIAPLYLEDARTIYLDLDKEASPERLARGSELVNLVHVRDYWGLDWSEWLSPKDLAVRLVRPFGGLAFTLYRVTNSAEIDPKAFLRFVGVWEKSNV